jgi:hypothetical protein
VFDLHSSSCYVRSIRIVLDRNPVLIYFVRDWLFRVYCNVCFLLGSCSDDNNTVATVPSKH